VVDVFDPLGVVLGAHAVLGDEQLLVKKQGVDATCRDLDSIRSEGVAHLRAAYAVGRYGVFCRGDGGRLLAQDREQDGLGQKPAAQKCGTERSGDPGNVDVHAGVGLDSDEVVVVPSGTGLRGAGAPRA
jgi:hypothetical protein